MYKNKKIKINEIITNLMHLKKLIFFKSFNNTLRKRILPNKRKKAPNRNWSLS